MGIHGITGNHDIANVSTFILILLTYYADQHLHYSFNSFVSELGTLHRSLIRERLPFPLEAVFGVL